MKTCPNPKCKTTGLPEEAIFCPNCGRQLAAGEWKTIDVSKYPSLFKQEKVKRKIFYLQNWANDGLSYSIDGVNQGQISRGNKVFIKIIKTATIRVSTISSSIIFRLYPNDIFENVVIESNGFLLQYKTY